METTTIRINKGQLEELISFSSSKNINGVYDCLCDIAIGYASNCDSSYMEDMQGDIQQLHAIAKLFKTAEIEV